MVVNTHEDPSSISLAVTLDAILAVQGIPIPLAVDAAHPWVSAAAARLLEAASLPAPQPRTTLERMRRHMPSALSNEARKLEKEVANTLPPVQESEPAQQVVGVNAQCGRRTVRSGKIAQER